jgi:phosphohistidine phosphatase
MKSLLLLRHGKSDWDADYVGDHERPVARKGRKAAAHVGAFLYKTDQVPELVLCSTALRTRQTLQIAVESGTWGPVDVEYDKTIYMAGYTQLVHRIAAIPDAVELAMLVGHEPTISLLAGQLIGEASVRFPTAAIARVDLNVRQWSQARAGIGSLMWHVIPKHLRKVM